MFAKVKTRECGRKRSASKGEDEGSRSRSRDPRERNSDSQSDQQPGSRCRVKYGPHGRFEFHPPTGERLSCYIPSCVGEGPEPESIEHARPGKYSARGCEWQNCADSKGHKP